VKGPNCRCNRNVDFTIKACVLTDTATPTQQWHANIIDSL